MMQIMSLVGQNANGEWIAIDQGVHIDVLKKKCKELILAGPKDYQVVALIGAYGYAKFKRFDLSRKDMPKPIPKPQPQPEPPKEKKTKKRYE